MSQFRTTNLNATFESFLLDESDAKLLLQPMLPVGSLPQTQDYHDARTMVLECREIFHYIFDRLHHSSEAYDDVINFCTHLYRICLDIIKDQHKSAIDLLSCMCLLDRRGIPRFLFNQDTNIARDFEDAMRVLTDLSLVTEKQDSIFEIHHLVQLGAIKFLDTYGNLQKTKNKVVALLSTQYSTGDYASWEIIEVLEPHAQAVLKYRYSSPHCRLQRARILHNCAWYACIQGEYVKAATLGQEAVDIRIELLEIDHTDSLASLGLLAMIHVYYGRFDEAEELQMRVLTIRNRVLGEDDPNTLIAMVNLSSTWGNQGMWKEAKQTVVYVVKTSLRVLGEEHPITMISMAILTAICRGQKRSKVVEEWEAQVVNARVKILRDEHPNMLASLINLVSIYRGQGRRKKADALHRQIMKAVKKEPRSETKLLRAQIQDKLLITSNLALRHPEQLKRAEQLGLKVVVISSRRLGEEHPDTVTSMINLAKVYNKRRAWGKTEALKLQIIITRAKVLGAEHPDTWSSILSLEWTLWNQGRWKEVEALRKDIMGFIRRTLEAGISETSSGMAKVPIINSKPRRWKTAEDLKLQADVDIMDFTKALIQAKKTKPNDSLHAGVDSGYETSISHAPRSLGTSLVEVSKSHEEEKSEKNPPKPFDEKRRSFDLRMSSDTGYKDSIRDDEISPKISHIDAKRLEKSMRYLPNAFDEQRHSIYRWMGSDSDIESPFQHKVTTSTTSPPIDIRKVKRREKLKEWWSKSYDEKKGSLHEGQCAQNDSNDFVNLVIIHKIAYEAIAERQLSVLLSQNSDLRPLCEEALRRMDEDRFVDQLQRLLKQYCSDLIQNAENNLEQATSRMLKSRLSRIRIARHIAANLKLEHDEIRAKMEQHMQETESKIPDLDTRIAGNAGLGAQNKKHQSEIWDDNPSRDNEDLSDGEATLDGNKNKDVLPNVAGMEDFLIRGRPFRALSFNLEVLLLPANLSSLTRILMSIPSDHIWFSAEDDFSPSNRMKAFVEDHTEGNWNWWPLRPRMRVLQDNQTRLHWRCVSFLYASAAVASISSNYL